MTKDDAPTYIAARRNTSPTTHLSADGYYTLCGWPMSNAWQRHTERVALSPVLPAGVKLCRECKAKAAAERAATGQTTAAPAPKG